MPGNSNSVLQGASEELEKCLVLSHPSGDGWAEWMERAQRRSGCSHSLKVSLQADEHHSKTEASDKSEGAEKGENKRWKGWQWCTVAEQDAEGFSIQWWVRTLSLKTFTEKDILLVDGHFSEIYNCSKSTKKTPNQNISFSLAKKMLMIFQMKYVLTPHRCLFVLENWSSCDVQNKTTKV